MKLPKSKVGTTLIIFGAIGIGILFFTQQQISITQQPPSVLPKNCQDRRDEIEQAFKNANYCENDTDCKTVTLGGSYIRFGCFKFVNKKTDIDTLFTQVKAYRASCSSPIDECASAPQPKCISNKCVISSE